MTSERSAVGRTLSDQAYVILHRRIVNCDIAPGATLTTREVSDKLGIGVTPVREALGRLQFAGLVETIPRIGYRVRPVTVADVQEVFEVWSIVGPELARLGLAALSPAEQKELQQLRRGHRLDPSDGVAGVRAWIELSHRIFLTYAHAAGNARLLDFYLRFEAELRRVFVVLFATDEAIERVVTAQVITPYATDDDDHIATISTAGRFVERLWDVVSGDLLRIPSVAAAEVSSRPASRVDVPLS